MSWQRVAHGYDGADQVAPPSFEMRTAGRLQPFLGVDQKTFSDTTATTPGWNGSAALLGSEPGATGYSWMAGAGRGVGTGVGVGDGVGVGMGVGLGDGDGEGLGVGSGVGVGDGVADAAPMVAIATEPTAAATTTREAMTSAPNASFKTRRRRPFGAAVLTSAPLPGPWPAACSS